MTEKVLYKSLRIGKGPTQIVPTVQYLTEDDNLNNGTGRLTYANGNEQNIPPEMQPRVSPTYLYFSL